jgi:hypothetical protein
MMGGGGAAMGEAARLFISIGLNSDAARKGLQGLSNKLNTFDGQTKSWSKSVSAAFAGPMQAFGNIGDAADGVTSVAGAISGLAQTLFAGAARNEQYAVSFEVMMGSAERAEEHISNLKEFAAETPFTLPGIVEASKQLEVMGGATLNTIDNVRLVGDVASGTGADIQAVGVQFGRMYDAMKNGTPLGEVMMRLGEMGALSGDSRRAIQGLAKSVSEGTMTMDEAWATASKEFGRFAGMTGKQSQTLAGLWSTFTDEIDDGFAQIGTKLLPVVKPVLMAAIELVHGLAAAGLVLVDNIDLLAPLLIGMAIPAIWAAVVAMGSLAATVILATWPFLAIGGAIAVAISIFKALGLTVDGVVGFFQTLVEALSWVFPPLKLITTALGLIGDAFGLFRDESETAMGPMTDMSKHAGKMADDLYQAAPKVEAASKEMFKPYAEEARRRAQEAIVQTRLMTTTVLETIKGARDAISGAATAAADALYDPLILKADLAIVQMQMKDKDLLAQIRGTNKMEKAEGQKRLAELQKQALEMEVKLTTYGDKNAQIAKTKALLMTTDWAAGVKAGNREQDAALKFLKSELEKQLDNLTYTGGDKGKKAGKAIAGGLKDGLPTAGQVERWGGSVAKSYANGWAGQSWYLKAKIDQYLARAKAKLESNSPPKEGPFQKIDQWGASIGQTFADALGGQAPYLGQQTNRFLGGADLASTQTAPSRSALAPVSAGGGGLVIHMDFNSAVPYTPGEMDALGRRVGPAVYEYLRQRGAVGA